MFSHFCSNVTVAWNVIILCARGNLAAHIMLEKPRNAEGVKTEETYNIYHRISCCLRPALGLTQIFLLDQKSFANSIGSSVAQSCYERP